MAAAGCGTSSCAGGIGVAAGSLAALLVSEGGGLFGEPLARIPAARGALQSLVMDYEFEQQAGADRAPAQPRYERLVMRAGRFYLEGSLPDGEPFTVQLGPSDASSEPAR